MIFPMLFSATWQVDCLESAIETVGTRFHFSAPLGLRWQYPLHTASTRDPRDGVICFDRFAHADTGESIYDPEAVDALYLELIRSFQDVYRPRSAVIEAMGMVAPGGHDPYVLAYVAPGQETENVIASRPVITGTRDGIASDFSGSSDLGETPLGERVDVVLAANGFILDHVLGIIRRHDLIPQRA